MGMENKTYAIIGSGMQGTAAGYDLARQNCADRLLMGDVNLTHAERNADRINSLVGKQIAEAVQVDALDPEALADFLQPVDVLLSCVPYWMHPRIAAVAIRSKTSMVDMGGDTGVTWETLKLDDLAKQEGVTVVPDTGLAPGFVNNLACYFMEKMEDIDTIRLYCGGLPQNPKPPFNYKLVFNVEGLVTEYSHQADVVREHKVVQVDTLAELEEIEIDTLGKMEAFTTSGGSSTAPFTFADRVRNYEYKTIRYPGHCERMRIFKDYGFWDDKPLKTRSGEAIPVEMFHKLMGDALRDPNDKDMIIVRGVGTAKDGKKMQIDVLEKHDDATGFTAMERMTGYSTATYAAAIGNGEMKPGCLRYEEAFSGVRFVEEIQKRGIVLKFS